MDTVTINISVLDSADIIIGKLSQYSAATYGPIVFYELNEIKPVYAKHSGILNNVDLVFIAQSG